jgi:SAM domain (Sterile alpha motif)
MDVVVWLQRLGLGKYEAAFRENEIDETVLPDLTADDLQGAWRNGSRVSAEAFLSVGSLSLLQAMEAVSPSFFQEVHRRLIDHPGRLHRRFEVFAAR